jgi:hypothetical protein
VRLSFGGIEIALSADQEILPPEDDAYREFVSASGRGDAVDTLQARIVVTEAPAAPGRVVFDSDAHWTVRAHERDRTVLHRLPSGSTLAIHFRPGSPQVIVECTPDLLLPGPRPALRCPIRYPFDQILAMYVLGRRGLLLHAAGMIVHGRTIVLPGVSGAGKSTFARLTGGRPGWEPLSDDRIIVRLAEDAHGASAWGTPWTGEGRVARNSGGPLARLLFLSQGDENRIEPVAPREAVGRLLPVASIPWYDDELLPVSLEACERLVERVPAAVLTFRPDTGAVDAVERLLAGGGGPSA